MRSLLAYRSAEVWKEFAKLQDVESTGVKAISCDSQVAGSDIYTIGGVKLGNGAKPGKGLYIINGKKVVVK